MSEQANEQAYAEVNAELHAACMSALAECVARGVSAQSVEDLAWSCGIDKRDLDSLYHTKEAA